MLLAVEDAQITGKESHVLDIDFENAFGNPDHVRLLWVMEYLGVSQEATNVVGNLYPGSREDGEPMSINVCSPCGDNGGIYVRRGAIQGDTLRPLLVLFYIGSMRTRRGTYMSFPG